MKRIYLDHAAGTPVSPRVFRAMKSFLLKDFGNPGGLYKEGVFSKNAITHARKILADDLGAHPDEIIFTSGGTEGNALVLKGAYEALKESGISPKKMHMITSAIEHPSVKEVFEWFEKEGVKLSRVSPEENGAIDEKKIISLVQKNTVLVSLMNVNNETGTVQPVYEVGRLLLRENKKRGSKIIFHVDACQAFPYERIFVEKLHADLITLSASKCYGPKGMGAIFVKRKIKLKPLFFGGSQEFSVRPGTENVSGIVGFGEAVRETQMLRTKESKRLHLLRTKAISIAQKYFPDSIINGTGPQAPHILNVSFRGIDTEQAILELDARGFAIASKSACRQEDGEVSYVIQALGKKHYAEGALRFSFGRGTTLSDVTKAFQALKHFSETMKRYQ